MANVNRILIKSKSSAAGAPSTSDIQVGELAVNTVTGLTYLGTNSSNTGLSAGGTPTEISTIGMPVDSSDSLGASDVKLATQGAIKTYVDGQVAAGDTTLANTKIWIGDGSGNKAEYALSGDVTMTNGGVVTIADDAVETDMINDNVISGQTALASGVADTDELLISDGGTIKRVDVSVLASNGSFASGTPTAITVADESSDTTCFPLFATAATGDLGPKTASGLTFNSSTDVLSGTFAGDITGDVTGNADTSTKIASITNSNIVQLTSSQTLTNKTLTSPTLTTPALGTPSALVLTNATALPAAQVAQGTMASGMVLVAPALGTPASGNLANCTFPTANVNTDVNVSVANLKTALAGGFGSNAVTIGDSDDVVTIGNDLTVTGDLLVSGDTVTVNTATMTVEDPLIKMASGNDADTVDVGLYAKYTASGAKYAGIIRDASTTGDPWTFFDSLTTEPTTTVTVGSNGFDYADIKAGGINAEDGFTGDLTGDVTGNADTSTKIASITNSNIVQLTSSQTLTNKSVDLGDNTLTGSVAEFNTALQSDSFCTLANTVTLTNKTLTAPTLTTPALGTPASGVMTNVSGTAASLTAGNATLAATSTLVDAAEASTTYYPVLVDGLTGAQALEAESGFTFVGNTGILTATGFAGALTGNVTGDVTGNADTSTKIASITNSNIVQLTSSQTLTNKTIDLANNTVTGSLSEFNSALQSESFCGLAATQTLTNKTIAGGTYS